MADTSLIAVGATACAAAAVFGGIAIKVQREHVAWCARAAKADGVVSRLGKRLQQGLSEDATGAPTGSNFILVPVVRFRDAQGFEYEIDAPEAPRTIGSVVRVAYDPAQPSGARAVDRVPKVGCAIILFVVGVILIAVGMSR